MLRPRPFVRHYSDDISKCVFLNVNVWISIESSMKFVPKGPIKSHCTNQWWLVYRRVYASLGFNEFIPWKKLKRCSDHLGMPRYWAFHTCILLTKYANIYLYELYPLYILNLFFINPGWLIYRIPYTLPVIFPCHKNSISSRVNKAHRGCNADFKQSPI